MIPVGISLGLATSDAIRLVEMIRLAEARGFESVWTAEVVGPDALTPAAWALALTNNLRVGTAVAQSAARSSGSTVMSARALNELSGGRFILGLGPSTPFIAARYHGADVRSGPAHFQQFREYVLAVRSGLARGPSTTGSVPVLLSGLGRGAVKFAATEADGWIPAFCTPERLRQLRRTIILPALSNSPPERGTFDVAPLVLARVGVPVEQGIAELRPWIARYLCLPEPNPYARVVRQLGHSDTADRVAAVATTGDVRAVSGCVASGLVEDIALLGDHGRVRDRVAQWIDAGATRLIVGVPDVEAATLVADALLG